MFRQMVFASCVCLFAQSVRAQEVQIELSGGAGAADVAPEAADGTAAAPSTASTAPSGDVTIPEGFKAKLDTGHALYLKGDYRGALTLYRAAKDSKSTDPLPLYFIACAQAKLEQYTDALTTLSALKTVCGDKLQSLAARSLFLEAVIEETRGNLENAKAAWTAYKQFATEHSDIPAHVASADARLLALEKKAALDEQYRAVRERIAGGTE